VKYHSYWLDTAPEGPDYSVVPIPDSVDVAVVGGGLTGLSAALHLRRNGASVVVLEAERMGWGASGRNGGMCTTGLSIGFLSAVDRFGIEEAQRLFLVYDDAIDVVEGLIRDEAIDCDFLRAGKLSLASKPSHYARLERTQELMVERLGRDTQLVPRDRLRSEIGTDAYYGGFIDPRAAGLHVGKYVRGLATAADRHGAQLREAARVTSIRSTQNGRYLVQTPRGAVSAKQVLVATDGYTDGVIPHYRRRIVPVGSFIVVTEPLGRSAVDELLPTRRMAVDSKNLVHYFRITPDDRLLFGGRAQFTMSTASTNLKSAKILTRDMIEIYPQLKDVRIDYAWGGQVGMTLDRMPHAGERNGIYYSLGYNGHGVQMATYMGRQIVEVMDGRADANPLRGLRFRAVPFHFGPPWFLPLADAYYRFRDAVS
jgi:glycine/D-amino acid oxidase-like deaminating enzyme